MSDPASSYVLWFEDCDASSGDRVGGKCANLGELLRAGLPVPPGFAVTVEAHAEFLERVGVPEAEVVADIDFESTADVERASAEIRKLVEATEIPEAVIASVREAYAELSRRAGVEALPVAVRSSAAAEDMADASFAGQLQTYLWIVGADAVIENLRRCWSGFYTPEAITYRRQVGVKPGDGAMSVAVQRMVDARSAGVMFTINPVNGDRSKIMVESTWGLGEPLVAGEISPDRFLVDKVTVDVIERTLGEKQSECRNVEGAVVTEPMDAARSAQLSVTDDELLDVARKGKSIEAHYGRPMDVEWAIDQTDGEVFMLQARPETVWSQRPRVALVQKRGSALDYVLADLLGRSAVGDDEGEAS